MIKMTDLLSVVKVYSMSARNVHEGWNYRTEQDESVGEMCVRRRNAPSKTVGPLAPALKATSVSAILVPKYVVNGVFLS
jgi:hypothetical protein